jgi:ABC-type bacteriocin/lantibiotic exporter with double-glycine peptidase domain
MIVKFSREIETDLINRVLKLQFNNSWKDLLLHDNKRINKLLLTDLGVYVSSGILLVLDLVKSFISIIFLFCFLIFIKGIVVVFFGFVAISIFLLSKKVFKKKLHKVSKNYSDLIEFRYELIGQLVNGIREIKINHLVDYYINKYYKNELKFTKLEILRKLSSSLPKISVEFLILLSIVLLIIFNLNSIQEIIPFAGVLAFILFRTQPLITGILVLSTSLQLQKTQISETQKTLDKIIYDDKFIGQIVNNNECKNNLNSIDIVEFKNVTFSYHNSKDIFTNLNLKFEKGNIYGIKGKNGAGKSTLADILAGLLEPDKGFVYVNGTDIKAKKFEWSSKIAYLSQSFFLFNDTIKKNITLDFDNQIKFDDESYNFAIKVSGLNTFFDTLIKGDSTLILDFGKNLSGGQKQKIVMARALYKNVDLIIFDEATSNLDNESINYLCKIQKDIKDSKIIINIAHSKNILDNSDKTLELINGKIIYS